MLSHPKEVLSRLPIEDLQLLQILKDAEPGMGKKAYHTSQVMTMAMLGLADQSEIDDGDRNDFDAFIPYVAPPKVGRNDPCPCGSGKKYKNCCGRGN